MDACEAPLHPAAAEGIRQFNRGEYFQAHESLEHAWLEEPGRVRELYRGILQLAVTYLHLTRNNFSGAVKVYSRAQKWMRQWPPVCRGIQVGRLLADAEKLMSEVHRLGPQGLHTLDSSLMRAILYEKE